MPRKLRGRLTYANVMVTLLLFIVLGGGAYAAFRLPQNSVRSRNIVNGQVKQKDLAPLPVDTSLDPPGGISPEATFKSHGGKLLIFASGSAFRNSNTFGEMAMAVKLDGSLIDVAQFFTNELNSHRSFVDAVTVVRRVAAGNHSLKLQPLSGPDCGTAAETTNTVCTATNSDDYFEASVLELPD